MFAFASSPLLLALLLAFAPASPSVDIADLSLPTLQGLEGYRLGKSVSGAGDVNGDGFVDVIVGANYADPYGRTIAGAAYVMFGNASGIATLDVANFTSSNSTGFIIQGAYVNGFLGWSVSGAGMYAICICCICCICCIKPNQSI
jgi:hypothetical protein